MLLAVVMVASLAVGCGGKKEAAAVSETEESKESVLVYGSGDYDSINPIMNEHCEIKHLLFDSLVARDGEGNLVSSLAKEWSYDEGTMTYNFKLRDGVKWHDGEAFFGALCL